MSEIVHTDPSLHTALAYLKSAAKFDRDDYMLAGLFRDMSDAKALLESPLISFSSPAAKTSFAIKDYAQHGVVVAAGGHTRSVFDEELQPHRLRIK